MFEDLREKVQQDAGGTETFLHISQLSPMSSPVPQVWDLKAAEIFNQDISMLRCQLLNSTSSPNSTDIPDLSEYELEVLSVLSRCEEHRQVADCNQLISTNSRRWLVMILSLWCRCNFDRFWTPQIRPYCPVVMTYATMIPCVFPVPVPVSNSDPRISRTCLPFARSSAACGTGASSLLLGHRSMQCHHLVHPWLHGIRLNRAHHNEAARAFLSTNEQVGLTSMRTLFYREHNRVVAALTSTWTGRHSIKKHAG